MIKNYVKKLCVKYLKGGRHLHTNLIKFMYKPHFARTQLPPSRKFTEMKNLPYKNSMLVSYPLIFLCPKFITKFKSLKFSIIIFCKAEIMTCKLICIFIFLRPTLSRISVQQKQAIISDLCKLIYDFLACSGNFAINFWLKRR